MARELNQRAINYRTGAAWTKDLVLQVIEQTAASGTYYWGKRRANRPRPREEWLPLVVTPVVDRDVFELAQRLRQSRDPSGGPGRAAARQHLLTGKLRCGRCGASYQLETSGKRVDGEVYRYCCYNCRKAPRSGVEVCEGFRIPTEALDAAVLEAIADQVCAPPRVQQLVRRLAQESTPEEVARAWRTLVTTHPVIGRSYVMHLVERIEVHRTRIIVVPAEARASAEPITSTRMNSRALDERTLERLAPEHR